MTDEEHPTCEWQKLKHTKEPCPDVPTVKIPVADILFYLCSDHGFTLWKEITK